MHLLDKVKKMLTVETRFLQQLTSLVYSDKQKLLLFILWYLTFLLSKYIYKQMFT